MLGSVVVIFIVGVKLNKSEGDGSGVHCLLMVILLVMAMVVLVAVGDVCSGDACSGYWW